MAVRLVAIGAPLAGFIGSAFSAVSPVNKYDWMEDELHGAPLPIDCDGPATWFVVAVPSALLLSAGGITLWKTGGRRARATVSVIAILSLVLLSAAIPGLYAEMRRNSSASSCN